MNYFIFVYILIFGELSIIFLSKSIYSLLHIFLIRLNGKAVYGKIIGYEEKSYYTKKTPSRFVRIYYPKVYYYVDGNKYISITKTAKNQKNKQYDINKEVRIYYNRKKPDQILIAKDYSCLNSFVMLIIGFVYLFMIYYLFNMVSAKVQQYAYILINIFLLSLLGIVVQTILRVIYGFIDANIAKKYIALHTIIYILFMILFLVVDLFI